MEEEKSSSQVVRHRKNYVIQKHFNLAKSLLLENNLLTYSTQSISWFECAESVYSF
jgi:hypothetical protein